jgi:hypothetical protein
MKKKILRQCLSYLCGLLLLLPTNIWAQQQVATISSLQEQVQKMKAIDSDPATPLDVRNLNHGFLLERRVQLRALLRSKIGLLEKYQAGMKGSLTDAENKAVTDSIRAFEKELSALESEMQVEMPGQSLARTPSSPSVEAQSLPSKISEPSPEAEPVALAAPVQQMVTPVTPATCNGSTDTYQDAPPLLRDAIEGVADDIISGAQTPTTAVSFRFPSAFFYAVAHAVAPAVNTSVASIKSLKAYQYLGETARTDKQVGAPAKAEGTTSAVEKPGFARLLGLAVENGAILQEVGKTSLTLSTSPYILYTFTRGGDTAENYQRAGVLNRIGIFATFNLTNQDNALANATRSQLSQWSIKARLFGDRSTRTKEFQNFWRLNIQPAIEKRLNALTNSFQATLPGLGPADFNPFTNVKSDINAVVATLMSSPAYASASDVEKKRLLVNVILCVFRSEVYNPITSGSTPISQASKDTINNQLVPSLATALKDIDFVRDLLKDRLDDIQKGPLGTLSYVNHRQTTGSDYSEGKFLFEQDSFHPMKMVANVGFSFYHRPDPTINQQKARDISAALSFEGKFDSPLLAGTADLSKITYAFTGSYQRTFENKNVAGKKADIGAFQFKLEFPLFAGVSIPFSLTYANATEQQNKQHVRANFGLSFDADKLFAMTRLMR